jgi:hypothetical protein
MSKKQLIPVIYGAVHDIKVNMLKFLHNLDTVTVTQIERVDKLQERTKVLYCNVEKKKTSSTPTSAKRTPSCTSALKKNVGSSKKQLDFDDNIDLSFYAACNL